MRSGKNMGKSAIGYFKKYKQDAQISFGVCLVSLFLVGLGCWYSINDLRIERKHDIRQAKITRISSQFFIFNDISYFYMDSGIEHYGNNMIPKPWCNYKTGQVISIRIATKGFEYSNLDVEFYKIVFFPVLLFSTGVALIAIMSMSIKKKIRNYNLDY